MKIHFANYPFDTLCGKRWSDRCCTALTYNVTCEKCKTAISIIEASQPLHAPDRATAPSAAQASLSQGAISPA